MIAPEDIEKIKAVSLTEAIGKEVELKQKGTDMVGLSPFSKERSASFTISESKQIWKCFSSGKGGKSAIDFYMELDKFEGGSGKWLDACKKVAQLMNIPLAGVVVQAPSKPTFNKRTLRDGEVPGTKSFEYKDFTDSELQVLGPKVSSIHCQRYHLHSVKTMSIVKENEVYEISSTDEFPIFAFDFKDWQKVYQPKAEVKSQRFSYAGVKPRKYIFGLDVIEKAFKENKKMMEAEDYNLDDKDPRVEAAFIMSGGSDGLNLASCEYYPVWPNSETEHLEWEDYKHLQSRAKKIYYIGDLDSTGKKEAIKVGLKYLDIHLVWLPEALTSFRDSRGNPCKDFKDYVTKFYNKEKPGAFKNTLAKLFENSLPFQFWTGYWKEKKMEYYISNTRLYHFLKHLGFGRYEHPTLKDGYMYIRKEGSIIRILEPYQISNFIHHFLEERQMPTDLRDYVYKTPILAEKSLANLPRVDIDFTVADKNTQYFFFPKKVWKITKDGVEDFNQGDIDKFLWEDKVIEFNAKLSTAPFEIKEDVHGDLDIEILQKDNKFFNYLINTSRVHWRKELEDSFVGKSALEEAEYFKNNQFNIAGANLSDDERLEQKLHLINKIYSIGYMLHQYKNESKAWCVYAMDNKISDQGESHGGSGKSICYAYLNHVLKRRVVLKGRDQKLTQNDFIYSGVTEDTDFIMIDDAHQYLDFEFFFSEITGSLIVNPKNAKPFEIPFSKSPKMLITSNFTPRNIGPSVARRILYTVFSDYYHYNKDNMYKQERQVSDDFNGKNLFKDFEAKDWDDVFNFWAYCSSFFLKWPYKISPPMDNVTKRNLLTEMGSGFKDWADVFFEYKEAPVGSYEEVYKYQNTFFSKDDAFSDFKNKQNPKNWTPQRFKKALMALCQYNGWIFNPIEMGVKEGRIMKKFQGTTQEVLFIKTFKDTVAEAEHAAELEREQNSAMQFDAEAEVPNQDEY